jgi:hypothetical protein
MRRYSAAIVLIFVLAVAAVRADDFWVKKDWKQWSKEDCAKIMKDSPWAHKWAQTVSTIGPGTPATSNNIGNVTSSSGASAPLGSVTGSAAGSAGDSKEEITYTVYITSSLAIREAMVRSKEIQDNYDKLDADKKKAYDARIEQFLGQTFDDAIIFHVTYDGSNTALLRALSEYWQTIQEESVPSELFMINEHGDRIKPVRFSSPRGGGNTMDIVFPKMQNNEPIIKAGDKELTLQFPSPKVVDLPRQLVTISFRVDKMTINGKTTF